MSRSTIPMKVAGLNAFVHGCLILYVIYELIHYVAKHSGRNLDVLGALVIPYTTMKFLLEFTVLTATVFLVIGIKGERREVITPWVYTIPFYILLCFTDLMSPTSLKKFDTYSAIKLVALISQAVTWYPIFQYWRDLRTRCITDPPQHSVVNVVDTATAPTMINIVGPENGPQSSAVTCV